MDVIVLNKTAFVALSGKHQCDTKSSNIKCQVSQKWLMLIWSIFQSHRSNKHPPSKQGCNRSTMFKNTSTFCEKHIS